MNERHIKRLPIEYQEIIDDIVSEEKRANPDVITPQDEIGNIWAMLINSESEDKLSQILGINTAQIREIANSGIPKEATDLKDRIDQTFALASILHRRYGEDYPRIWQELSKPNVYLGNKTPMQAILQGEVHLVLLATKVR